MEEGKLARTDDDIIREARERLRLSSDAESANRTLAISALSFRNGQQWPVDVRRDRETDARPCLTINITDAVVRRIENACRENRPRIKVDPIGDGADIDTAKVLNGLIRHIENISGADYAYDCATSSAIGGGWGWISLTNDYVDEKSFDQELLIQAHRNPFRIYPDPASQMPDGSDLCWLLESEMIPRTDYRDLYGHLDEGGWQFIGSGDDIQDWSNQEQIRVAKYWRIEHVKDELVKLADGRIEFKSKLDFGKLLPSVVVSRRPTIRKQVKCYLMSAFRILKTWDWPGKYIPYVPVYGRELDINGKTHRKGAVYDLMDPARMYNYSETAKTEVYALQPKAPWMGPEGSTQGHEAAWRDANRKPVAFLEYKQQYAADGITPLPAPQRQEPPPLGQGFQEWSQSSQSNFMAVAGMPHDPNQDAKGEVVSGIALKRRQGLSDISHFDFYDNLTRSLKQLGRVIIDLIPHFYPGERMQRIVRDDGTSEMVQLNQRGIDEIKNNVQVGRYAVTVDTGPSYQTKREESAEALLELITGTGKFGEMLATAAADKAMRQFDFPDADAMADRLASLIPAAQAEKDMANMSADQLKSMVSGLQAQLAQANQKSLGLELELQSKHGLEELKQSHEDKRHAATLQVKREDVLTKAHTAVVDTHTKAQASIAVAEINQTGNILGKHVDNAHEKELSEKQLESAEKIAASKPAPKAG